jgi:hypothetical protein
MQDFILLTTNLNVLLQYRKFDKTCQQKTGRWDLPTQVSRGNYPRHGIVQMQHAVEQQASSGIAYADAVKDGNANFTVYEYNKYSSLLAAALVSFSPQGRSRAIESMPFSTFMKFYEAGEMPSSTNFKTSWVYGRQVITIGGPLVKLLVDKYVQILRPAAVTYRLSIGIHPKRTGKVMTNCTFNTFFLFYKNHNN